jgi:RNA recognition motif-containing protein
MNPVAHIINEVLVKNNGVKNIPKSIRLGNLPREMPNLSNTLNKIFNEIGHVRDVYIPVREGLPIGYAFVEFLDSADAMQAVAYFCRGLKLGENKVRVELAEGKRRQPAEMISREVPISARLYSRVMTKLVSVE